MNDSEGERVDLLERDAERAQLAALVEATVEGRGGLVVIEGPAGIGKTRLLREAASGRAAGAGPLEALTAEGSELERDIAFGVVRQWLEPWLAATPADRREEALEGAAHLAAPALGIEQATGRPGAAEPDPSGQFSALHGLYWLVANIAARSPLLLVVDDAHWADRTSLRFLSYLARRLEGIRIGVVLATRPLEPEEEMEEIGRLARGPLARIVSPAPLSVEAVGRLLRERVAAPLDEGFVERCHVATGGNPLLARELVAGLRAEGVDPAVAPPEVISELGPRGVARWIALRLERLPAGAVDVARSIAVLGSDADPQRVLAMVAGKGAARAAIDALIAEGILERAVPLRFTHPIVRSAIYAHLSPVERGRSHGQAARILIAEGADPERIASHLLAAEPAADQTAVAILEQVAERALQRGAPDAACAYLRRAVVEPPGREQRGLLLLGLGTAEFLAGRAEAVAHLTEALEAAPDPIQRAGAALTLSSVLLASRRFDEAIEALERVSGATTSGGELTMVVEGALLSAAQLGLAPRAFTEPRRRRLSELAQSDDASAPAPALATLAVFAVMDNEPASKACSLAEAALGAGERANGLATAAPYFYNACGALIASEQFGRVQRLLDEELEGARARGAVPEVALAAAWRSVLGNRRGELSEAEADARTALAAADQQPLELLRALALGSLIDSLLEQGHLDDAEHALDLGGVELDAGSFHHATLIQRRGRLRRARGADEEGLSDALTCGEALIRAGAVGPALAAWRSDAALAHLACGRADEAAALADEEVELARAFGAPRTLGVALRAKALTASGGPSRRLLEESASKLESSASRLEHARVLTDLGAAMRRAGERAGARERLRTAMDIAHRCGAAALAERAETEIRATGARPRRLVLTGVDSLTVSERRVAELAAKGMLNREIAQALFVTTRTVEGHLTSVYRKLGVGSRRELDRVLG